MRAYLLLAVLTAGCYAPPTLTDFKLSAPLAAPSEQPRAASPSSCRELSRIPPRMLRKSTHRHAAAEARIERSLVLPQLRSGLDLGDPQSGFELGLRWQPPIPGLAGAVQAEAQNAADVLASAVDLARTAARRRIQLAHLGVRQARSRQQHLKALRALEQVAFALVKKRLELGHATRIDLASARFELDGVLLKCAAADTALARAEARLLTLSGQTADDSKCTVLAQGPAEHPAIAAAYSALLAADANLFSQRRKDWFWPDFVELKWDDIGEDDDRLLLQFGITLSVSAAPAVAVSQRKLHAAQDALEDTRAGVKTRSAAATARLASARTQLALSESLSQKTTQTAQDVINSAQSMLGVDRQRLNRLERSALRAVWGVTQAAFAVERAEIELLAARAGVPE